MPRQIRIIVENAELSATLNDSLTGVSIRDALPLEGRVRRWGDEVYFEIPVRLEEAPDARADMAVGELGYWPVGPAFCIFFGPTPASAGKEPRAYSNVNPFGRVDGEISAIRTVLDNARDGGTIRVVAM